MSRRPISLVREAMKPGLTEPFDSLVVVFGGFETEIALQMPTVERILFGVVSLGLFGLSPAMRTRVESGVVRPYGYGATSLLRALQAGCRSDGAYETRIRPPFMAAQGRGDDGTVRLNGVRPNDSFIHVPFADPDGRRAWGYGVGPDLILASASESVRVSYDVSVSTPPPYANCFTIPSHLIEELEHRPFGAFPTASFPLYQSYAPFIVEYLGEDARGREALLADPEEGGAAGDHQSDRPWLLDCAGKSGLLQIVRAAEGLPSDPFGRHRQKLLEWI